MNYSRPECQTTARCRGEAKPLIVTIDPKPPVGSIERAYADGYTAKAHGILVNCTACGEQLKQPGALLIGPPYNLSWVMKMHLCVGCYPKIIATCETLNAEARSTK